MNEQLEQVEQQLADMPFMQKIALYVVLVGCMVYMSWNFFGEDISNEIETKQSEIVALEQKLQKNSVKSLEKAIKKAHKDYLSLQDKLTNLTFKDQYIQSKLDSLDFIYFSQDGKAQILDNILKTSIKNHINVKYITSVDLDEEIAPHISKKQLITIEGDGSFKDILSLLQYVDSLKTLIQLDNLQVTIDKESKTVFVLKLSLYGADI